MKIFKLFAIFVSVVVLVWSIYFAIENIWIAAIPFFVVGLNLLLMLNLFNNYTKLKGDYDKIVAEYAEHLRASTTMCLEAKKTIEVLLKDREQQASSVETNIKLRN
jgi:hypothetical protein